MWPVPFIDIVPKRAENLIRGGYLRVFVGFGGKQRKTAMAHRIVWQHFFGDIPSELQINHKNGIKTDNSPDNLELVTARENILHAFRVIKTRTCVGVNHSQHKLTDKDIVDIRKRVWWDCSMTELSKEYHVSIATISNIFKRKSWKHVQ